MTLIKYIYMKFFGTFAITGLSSFSIFYIFSLIGYLGEDLSFITIVLLSFLNSIQIFTYIPSYLLIITGAFLIIILKSKNELVVIKEYISINLILIIMTPIFVMFSFLELNKNKAIESISYFKDDMLEKNQKKKYKVLITNNENDKTYSVFKELDLERKKIKEYVNFVIVNQKIANAEFSNNLFIKENEIFLNNFYSYNKNSIQNNEYQKKIKTKYDFNFKNNKLIIKNEIKKNNQYFSFFQNLFFYILFYLNIYLILFGKNLIHRNFNLFMIFIVILSLFIYSLIIPRLSLDNFNILFHSISIIILITLFFKRKIYE